MKQQLKHDISKIAQELSDEGMLEIYWDYRDKLSDEQIIKILTKEDGLLEIENELYEDNIEYQYEIIMEAINRKIKEDGLDLTDEEVEDLRLECESIFDFDITWLIKNSDINIRVTLESNNDTIYFGVGKDVRDNETIKEFKKRFRGKYKKEDLDKEINNVFNYGEFTFYFNVSGEDILTLKEQIEEGYIELRGGLFFGLFDSYNGSGSVLEMELTSPIKLNLKDWRMKNTKEAILQKLDGKDSKYWNVSIKADNLNKYGIEETYGMGGWQEW